MLDRWRFFGLGALAGLLFGKILAFALAGAPEPLQMPPDAPEVRKAPGALLLKREGAPGLAADLSESLGAPVVRRIALDLEPIQPGAPVHLELYEVQTPEGTRIEARTEDGKILAGLDQQVRPTAPPAASHAWTVAITRGWARDRWEWGGVVQYEAGPFVAVFTAAKGGGALGVGLRF